MTAAELAYVAAGYALPLFYLPQIRMCLRDQSQLASYSLRKAVIQCALRVVMMPFIWGIGNVTMTMVVSLDLLGWFVELASAVASLRRQGVSWTGVLERARPRTGDGNADSPPQAGMPP